MAKIRMMNMVFYGFQGVYEYEKEQGAKLSVDVEMVTRDDKACDTDQIEDGAGRVAGACRSASCGAPLP